MVLSRTLSRSLRAREEESDDEPYSDELAVSSPSILDTAEGDRIISPDPESAEEDEDEDEEEDPEEDVQAQMSKVSFGALARAQEAIAKENKRKRKRGEDEAAAAPPHEDKLQALRERLRELRAVKKEKSSDGWKKVASTAKPSKKAAREESDESDGDTSGSESDGSDDEDDDKPKRARSSKHAPTEQSSKRAVTRKRTVVEVPKRHVRDPRFDAVGGPKPDEATLKKKYGFLKEYRASEMQELREAIKQTKNEEDRAKLRRRLQSMESQRQAEEAKERNQAVLREHRKKERELVKEGKKPFFLKKSEQKKLALVDQFENLKGKQKDRAIERRRKKLASREKKSMPAERRRY